jgi:hypothetical protein
MYFNISYATTRNGPYTLTCCGVKEVLDWLDKNDAKPYYTDVIIRPIMITEYTQEDFRRKYS